MKKQRTDATNDTGATGNSDRRAHERVLVDLHVDYSCDENFLFAYITDISNRGIFVRTTMPHPPGTRLNLHFTPAGDTAIDVEGEVVWINVHGPDNPDCPNPGMGIRFVDLDAATQDRVQQLVRTIAYLNDDESALGHS